MKVLVIGGGGREHALVWKLRQSSLVSRIWCAPGNGGIAQDAECISLNLADIPAVADFAEGAGIDLTVVGPEQPLVDGIADEFARRRLNIIGPSADCARLEGSKVFAKAFLDRHKIPTARAFGVFASAPEAIRRLESVNYPAVLKADGLCAGKGVLVARAKAEASDFAERALEKREFGEGGSKLLIEEALCGEELSYIVLSDGRNFVPLVPTRDHKRAFDGDCGPNTGGMGAYSCDGIITPAKEHEILEKIVQPTLSALSHDGCTYCGFLYFGLMLTPEGPKVLEFNCRLGDPETQAIVARMDFDLAAVLKAAAQGVLDPTEVKWRPGASVCVVLASAGYPGRYASGKKIHGLEDAAGMPQVQVFHAGTKCEKGMYYTSSGRVVGVTAMGDSVNTARRAAYDAVQRIRFSECQYRTDIALAACRVANAAEQ